MIYPDGPYAWRYARDGQATREDKTIHRPLLPSVGILLSDLR